MIYVIPSCFEGFSCIADRCPDTCCAGWEVDLDREILEKYEALPGPLGEEIRSRIKTQDGYTFFEMEQHRCPFLNEKNLCRLILEGGEACLSTTCREHPRFWEEYGELQETCLAISCPEAARLLLSQPLRLTVKETEEPGEIDWELDEALLDELLTLRDEMFRLAAEKHPISQRMVALKELSREFQNMLEPMECPPSTAEGFLRAMTKMEFTDDRLKQRLNAALKNLPAADKLHTLYNMYEMEAENLLLYFLYRYVLRAVWDGYVVEKVLLCTHSVEAIFTLTAAQPGDFRKNLLWSAILYSREVEHSPENLELLYGYLGGE